MLPIFASYMQIQLIVLNRKFLAIIRSFSDVTIHFKIPSSIPYSPEWTEGIQLQVFHQYYSIKSNTLSLEQKSQPSLHISLFLIKK